MIFAITFQIFPPTVKPQSKPKMQTFYGLKEGSAETVTIKFEANPPPTEGMWKIEGIEIPLGAESLDKNYMASLATPTQARAFTQPTFRGFVRLCIQSEPSDC